MKFSNKAPGWLLQPIPLPTRILEDLTMGFITNLPNSCGYETVLVVVDRLSKQTHFGVLPRIHSAPKVADLFTQMVC